MSTTQPYIGRSVRRVEDGRFLTGRGQYTDDVRRDGALYCAFVRSPHAHARILSIDIAGAQASPGVVAVLTGADYRADGMTGVAHMPNPADAVDVSQRAFAEPVVDLPHWPLALERVRHVGEALAVVLAHTVAAARDAAELVYVDYETLDAAVSVQDAVASGAPLVWEEAEGNLCFAQGFGDREATRRAIEGAACVVRHEFVQNRIANCQMEPRSALAEWSETHGLTLTSGSQGVFLQKISIARALGLPPEKVRVICPDVGGGFGPRTDVYPEQVVVAWAARKLGRPVKWTSDRSEAFLTDYQGRDGLMRAELALDSHGRILAYALEWLGNVGAHTVSFVSISNGRRMLGTVYRVPVAHVVAKGVMTHTVPTAPYRGAGRPEATHLMERLLDMAARRLGLDPAEIRRRNLVTRAELPYRSVTGLHYDSGDFAAYMERALESARWSGFADRKAAAAARGRLAGIGVANHIEAPVGAPIERVTVEVSGEGVVDVVTGTQSTGQGHETSFAQVAADQFGVPLESVRVRYGDTAFVTLGGGTHSDRSARLAGTLMVQACRAIVDEARERAAEMLEVAAGDLQFADGAYRVAGTDRSVTLFAVAKAAADARASLMATRDFKGRIPAYPAGTAVCELEIDSETGIVEITRYTTVDDVGRPINPMIVEGQTHGGIAQGIGQALHEGMQLAPDSGQVLSGSFMDYGICRAEDLPSFNVAHIEDRTLGNPLNIKGGGEGGIVPASPAVLNALCDALGVADIAMPATPAVIWETLRR